MAGAWLLAPGAGPALAGEGICAMGGAMIRAEVDRDKAVGWGREQPRAAVSGTDGADWSVLAISRGDADVAILVAPGGVFFGVAGRGGEVYPRDLERAFGKDLGKLREAVRRGLGELWKSGAVKVAGGDVQAIADAAGLGVLEKGARGWSLTTRECQPVDLPASGL
jgi:hypothetical protein